MVSIIARLLSMQVNNAAVAYRLFKARNSNVLPHDSNDLQTHQKGYTLLRHQIVGKWLFGRSQLVYRDG